MLAQVRVSTEKRLARRAAALDQRAEAAAGLEWASRTPGGVLPLGGAAYFATADWAFRR